MRHPPGRPKGEYRSAQHEGCLMSAVLAAPAPGAARDGTPAAARSAAFAALVNAFRASGGTARGDDLARLLEDHQQGDFVSLARLIASGHVFGFDWRGVLWIPMFQYDLRTLSIRPGPHQVLAELAGAFEGWALASWFAQPNAWLGDRKPVDLLDSDLAGVLQAARADRFIAAG